MNNYHYNLLYVVSNVTDLTIFSSTAEEGFLIEIAHWVIVNVISSTQSFPAATSPETFGEDFPNLT